MVNWAGNTAWDEFIWVSYAKGWKLSGLLRPTAEEKEAFVRLYIGVRNRNLENEVETLQRIRQYLLHEDQRGAAAALAPLIKQKMEWERWDLVHTYKTVGLQIREAMWDAAIESVDEKSEVLREEMGKSPWQHSSRWDWLLHDYPEETASESENGYETTIGYSEEEYEGEDDEDEEEDEEEEWQLFTIEEEVNRQGQN
ncbi:uncharacterized protein ColSpa_10252 [Colletotrichum spaethianum]|uniref:Uncharacterized protein n=1 Tax=Colletotrichum spaethianum TaxID=700344 RepID=A0AA37UKH8_9PEZI|nr:uncharacterized protein ColSpa_10252 [Colletotrichum spaethianum]GKT50071.1 hypothetical protein ColSpa_10252 [Colletotrichum spaethianum]